MASLMIWLAVATGSALGGVSRYGVGLLAARLLGSGFPWGTLLINIAGSFIIGLFAAVSASPELRIFVMVGFCGGFTTFSSFSLQTMALLQAGEWLTGGVYILSSVALCLAGVFLGYWLATRGGA